MNYIFLTFFLVISTWCFGANTSVTKNNPDLKILVLIIASDQVPVYVELQKIWRRYMHFDPAHVEAYFIKGNPNLKVPYQFEGDIIWSKTDEGWSPDSAGIINKTILSMEAMLGRLHEFDYVLRTNLSSFYAFPTLLSTLQHLPRQNCYFAHGTDGENKIGSGCGFILSRDLVELLVKNKREFLYHHTPTDDQIIGEFLISKNIKLIPHARLDLIAIEDWDKIKNNLPDSIFHFRIKTDYPLRMRDDIRIHNELINIFYTV